MKTYAPSDIPSSLFETYTPDHLTHERAYEEYLWPPLPKRPTFTEYDGEVYRDLPTKKWFLGWLRLEFGDTIPPEDLLHEVQTAILATDSDVLHSYLPLTFFTMKARNILWHHTHYGKDHDKRKPLEVPVENDVLDWVWNRRLDRRVAPKGTSDEQFNRGADPDATASPGDRWEAAQPLSRARDYAVECPQCIEDIPIRSRRGQCPRCRLWLPKGWQDVKLAWHTPNGGG